MGVARGLFVLSVLICLFAGHTCGEGGPSPEQPQPDRRIPESEREVALGARETAALAGRAADTTEESSCVHCLEGRCVDGACDKCEEGYLPFKGRCFAVPMVTLKITLGDVDMGEVRVSLLTKLYDVKDQVKTLLGSREPPLEFKSLWARLGWHAKVALDDDDALHAALRYGVLTKSSVEVVASNVPVDDPPFDYVPIVKREKEVAAFEAVDGHVIYVFMGTQNHGTHCFSLFSTTSYAGFLSAVRAKSGTKTPPRYPRVWYDDGKSLKVLIDNTDSLNIAMRETLWGIEQFGGVTNMGLHVHVWEATQGDPHLAPENPILEDSKTTPVEDLGYPIVLRITDPKERTFDRFMTVFEMTPFDTVVLALRQRLQLKKVFIHAKINFANTVINSDTTWRALIKGDESLGGSLVQALRQVEIAVEEEDTPEAVTASDNPETQKLITVKVECAGAGVRDRFIEFDPDVTFSTFKTSLRNACGYVRTIWYMDRYGVSSSGSFEITNAADLHRAIEKGMSSENYFTGNEFSSFDGHFYCV